MPLEQPSPVLPRLRPRRLPSEQPTPVLPRLRPRRPRLPSPSTPAAAHSMVIEEEQPSPVLPRLRPRPRRLPSPATPGAQSDDDDYLPSVKKQKANAANDEGDGFCPYFPRIYRGAKLGDLDCWSKYFDQINESEGFDIKDYPGTGPLTSIFPLICYLDYPKNVRLLESYATKALEQYNAKFGTKYEVKEILKVNRRGCRDLIFYITLTVKNGEEEYFQIKVVRRLDKSLKFPIIRPPRAKKDQDLFLLPRIHSSRLRN